MVTPSWFKFAVTLTISVIAFVLVLLTPDELGLAELAASATPLLPR